MDARRTIATLAAVGLASIALVGCDEGAPSVGQAPAVGQASAGAPLPEEAGEPVRVVTETREILPLPPVPASTTVELHIRSGSGSSRVLSFRPDGPVYTVAVTCRSAVRGAPLRLVDLRHSRQSEQRLLCGGRTTSTVVRLPQRAPQRLQLQGSRKVSWAAVVYSGLPVDVQLHSG